MKTMIEKQFVTYKIALALKELGFDEPCIAIYRDGWNDFGVTLISDGIKIKGTQSNTLYYKSDKEMICLAPLYQQAIDWFREKHNIHIEIELTDNTMQFYYQYCIVDSKNREHHDEDMIDQATRIYNYNEKFNTFYEAREQAILKLIELCQAKQLT